MFIAFNKETKKVHGEPSSIPFANVSSNLLVAEVKEIPTYNKATQFLTAINEREETETIVNKFLVETFDENGDIVTNEQGEPVLEEVEEIEERTYLTCDLVVNDKPPVVLTEAQKHEKYKRLVRKYIREKYSQDDVEALQANYLSNNATEEAKLEWQSFQEYRVECKAKAKAEVYGE